MNVFKKLAYIFSDHRAEHQAATENSRALLQEALRSAPEVDEARREALAKLCTVTEQAKTLKDTDRQNHYSESLTHAFRGRTA